MSCGGEGSGEDERGPRVPATRRSSSSNVGKCKISPVGQKPECAILNKRSRALVE
jgi:hypothetical protein